MSSESSDRRLLSIQSHVSSGYVGNRAATFPLQVLGWDVDVVNSVQYSNHAGYGHVGGPKTDAAQLNAIFQAMEDNGLMVAKRILTGYIPGGEPLKAVAELVKKRKEADQTLLYFLDPVMGDEGRLYVDADVIPIYRDMLLPFASVITPNWFEAELLTGIRLNSLANLRTALRSLHQEHGVPNVVISSLVLQDTQLPEYLTKPDYPANPLYAPGYILCVASTTAEGGAGGDISRVHAIAVPKINGYFSGVGDLFSALLVAHYDPSTSNDGHTPISWAATKAVNTIHAVLLQTQSYYVSLPEDDRPDTDSEKDKADMKRRARRMKFRELRLVQALDVIRLEGSQVLGDLTEWKDFWTE